MVKNNEEIKLLSVHKAAAFLGVSAPTIRLWAQTNKLKGIKVGIRGDWRFTKEELSKMIKPQKDEFYRIKKYLLTYADHLQKNSVQEKQESGVQINIYNIILVKVDIIKQIANNLNDLEQGKIIFNNIAERLAINAIKEDITIEKVINEMIFFKQAIWERLEQDSLLFKFKLHDFYKFSHIFNTYWDIITTKIIFTYNEAYNKSEEEHDKLISIVETSEDAIVSKTLDGTITSWNKSAEKMFGYTAQEVIGKNISLIIPQELQEEEDRILNRLKRGIRVNHYKTVRLKKDGTKIKVSLSISPIRDATGKIIRVSKIARDITKQEKTENALRESEEKFRTLADNIPTLCWMARADGWIYWYNKRWYEYTGTKPKDMEGWGWQSIHNPKNLPEVLKQWKKSLKTGKPFDMIFPIKSADGEFRPFLTRVVPVKDGSGKITHWFGTNTDITERKKIEVDLNKNVKRFELLSMTAEELLYAENPQRVIDSLCKKVMRYLKCQVFFNFIVDEKAGKLHLNACEGIPRKDKKELEWLNFGEAVCGYVAKTGNRVTVQHIPSTYDKRTKLIKKYGVKAYCCHPLKDAHGKVVGTLSFGAKNRETFTEDEVNLMKAVANQASTALSQQKAVEALKRSETRIRRLFDANIVGIIYWNINGTILQANDVFLNIVGYNRDDLEKGKIDWIQMTPSEYKDIDEHAVIELNKLGYHQPVEKEYIRKDEKRVHVLVGSTFFDEMKQEGVGFVLDITQRKMLEKQKDEFISIASHELRTPVTSIKAYTQVMQKMFRKKGDDNSASLLGKMDVQIDKLTSLIGDLLDVSKIEAGKLQFREESFDFNELVNEIVEDVQRTANHHTILTELSKSKMVYGDRDRIGQVIINFLTNAIKYSPQADTVIVKTFLEQNTITFCVQDFGTGIPNDNLEKVFERFYRVEGKKEATYSGLGLGLFIASEIIRRQDGKIWVESEVGKGSTFYFSLPIQKQKILRQTVPLVQKELKPQ